MANLEIIYKDFKILHPVGSPPKLILIFNLNAIVAENLAIYIPHLKWEINLNSTLSLENGGMSFEGEWGLFESIGTEKLFTKDIGEEIGEEIFCAIPMDSQKIQQLVNIRSKNRFPRLSINALSYCLKFESKEGSYLLKSIRTINLGAKMYSKKGTTIPHITFDSGDTKNLLEKLGKYELKSIEIYVKKEGTPTNKRLAEAVGILDIAKKDLLNGNSDGVLNGTRKAINRIIKKDKTDPNKMKWIFKDDIIDDFLDNTPTTARDEYEDLLNKICDQFRSQLRIINDVFMHKDKRRVNPRPEDLEQILCSTAFLIQYLSKSCGTSS